MPKLSFIISTYKAERFIERRLRNLLCEQSEQDIEVIIVDSQSPENEKVIVEKWQALFPNRVTYLRQSKRTPFGYSWIKGVELATGEFWANMNCDDRSHVDYSRLVYNQFKKAPKNVGFIYTGIQVSDELGNIKGAGYRPPFDRDIMTRECHTGPSIAFRNGIEFKNTLDWNLIEKRSLEHKSAFDYWLVLMLISKGYDGLAIPDILTFYTQRNDSIENSDKWTNNYETYASISEFFPHNFATHLKHAKEFADFSSLPPKEEWIALNRQGKKWK